VLLEILTNTCAWTAIQLGLVLIASRIPPQRFAVRAHSWERNGRLYHSLGVGRWKDKLPDGGRWFSNGFGKRKLCGRNMAEVLRFARESRRGELVHWCAIAALPLFALWNTSAGMLINATYAVAANLPCIIVQRYNQARIFNLVKIDSGNKLQPLPVNAPQ
jgi:glycosyl-4,4'-diaponeurosporenoate acyltransferase